MSKQLLLALGAGGAATAAVIASAASIGSVNSTELGAGDTVVTSCDDAISVDYTTTFDAGAYKVTAVDLAGIDDEQCAGQTGELTLFDGSNAELVSLDIAAISGATATLTVEEGEEPDAEDVEGVALVISGDDVPDTP